VCEREREREREQHLATYIVHWWSCLWWQIIQEYVVFNKIVFGTR